MRSRDRCAFGIAQRHDHLVMTAYERIGIAREFDACLGNSLDALSARIRTYARRRGHERASGGLPTRDRQAPAMLVHPQRQPFAASRLQRQRAAGDEARDTRHRVQRQHQQIAREHAGHVGPIAGHEGWAQHDGRVADVVEEKTVRLAAPWRWLSGWASAWG